jgi:hypothetical protein
MGEHELRGKVAAVLNSRLSPERVAAVVEILYASLTYSSLEKALSAARPKVAACRATTEAVDRIHCGHNPWLYARPVTALREKDGALTWTEPPAPKRRGVA